MIRLTKTAIVTGASSGSYHCKIIVVRFLNQLAYIGIGKHSDIALTKAGWNVVLIARRELEMQETAAQ